MPPHVAPTVGRVQRPLVVPGSLSRWIRNVHLYAGLAVSPFVILYALSAILLNHAYLPWGGRRGPVETRQISVVVGDAENSLAVAKGIRRQTGIPGEIGYVSRDRKARRINFPVETPGHVTNVRVDLAAGVATIDHRETGVWDAVIYLHKMPGPHNASIRGNGVYLWTLLAADRKAGVISLGVGALSFMALVMSVVA